MRPIKTYRELKKQCDNQDEEMVQWTSFLGGEGDSLKYRNNIKWKTQKYHTVGTVPKPYWKFGWM